MMTQSIISELTILNLNQSDSGAYICTVPDTELQQILIVTISKSITLFDIKSMIMCMSYIFNYCLY